MSEGTCQRLDGIVRPGKGNAAAHFIGPHRERWEHALDSAIYPASLNVYVAGDYGAWDWCLSTFNENSCRVECDVEGVPSYVVWLRCPGPSWNEGHDAENFYPDDTMLEIICSRKIDGVHPGSTVSVDVDVNALLNPPKDAKPA